MIFCFSQAMSLLVVYGFHREEKEFGQAVDREFFRRNRVSKSTIFMPLEHSAGIQNKLEEKRAFDEVSDLIRSYRPQILFNIHHSKPIHPNDDLNSAWKCIEFYSSQLNNPFTQRLFSREKAIPIEIHYHFFTPNKKLQRYIFKNEDFAGFLADLSKQNGQRDNAEEHYEVIRDFRVDYFLAEALLRGEDGAISQDNHYYDVVDRMVRMIEGLSGFSQRKTLLQKLGFN